MPVTAIESQSLLDLSVQTAGSVEGVFSIAMRNALSITDALTPGVTLTPGETIDTEIVAYYRSRNHAPATEITEMIDGGIGYMGIEIDFIVS